MIVTIVKPNPDEMFNTTKSFLLIEIHSTRSLQIFIFLLLLVSYLITLAGNILIVALTLNHPSLHTPMYFFVSNLSIVEICITTTITPKFLSIVGFGNRVISYWGCVFQCYFYFVLASIDFFLLGVMSFDRYVAICQPLHYVTVMSHRVILYLAAGSWLCGFADTLPTTILTSNLPFCGSNVIQHFFCDIDPILKLVFTPETWQEDTASAGSIRCLQETPDGGMRFKEQHQPEPEPLTPDLAAPPTLRVGQINNSVPTFNPRSRRAP
ncbi:olfactory receptor 6J1-like [Bufo gargarizans]|uniref:olfactory receptor 6J1-like n=1 Tax=Bufo gargarizans TaxID=30331 RepID=UPI001CF31D92|nr:olfactory receptor 6J1-like [Bufo gargarizans]